MKENNRKNRKMKEETQKEADLRAGMLMYNVVDAPGGVESVRVLQERLLGDKRVAEAPLAQRPTRTAKGARSLRASGIKVLVIVKAQAGVRRGLGKVGTVLAAGCLFTVSKGV
jgi:hypothetical protein